VGQECQWPKQSQIQYNQILLKASNVIVVSDGGYDNWKMQVRNEYLVDHCDVLVALWDGSSGGTGNCISYAYKKNKKIINLWEIKDCFHSYLNSFKVEPNNELKIEIQQFWKKNL
jgi:uncharacterized phage-like protein YoqJ